jgi:hypothetical protein
MGNSNTCLDSGKALFDFTSVLFRDTQQVAPELAPAPKTAWAAVRVFGFLVLGGFETTVGAFSGADRFQQGFAKRVVHFLLRPAQ